MAKNIVEINKKDLKKLTERIDGERIAKTLRVNMWRATLDTQGKIVESKLSGQVLHRQTGRLAQSIHSFVDGRGFEITGHIGTNVEYARIHEFGGIIRAKNAPKLKFKIGGQFVSVDQVEIPERSYMRSTLEENSNRITQILSEGLLE